MREQILNRFGRPVDGDARLGGRLAIKRDGVDVESTGSDDAEAWRITPHRQQVAQMVDLCFAVGLVRSNQEAEWRVLRFIYGANAGTDATAEAPGVSQGDLGEQQTHL